jgi:hypothetical protein
LSITNSTIETIPTDIKCKTYMDIKHTTFVNKLLKQYKSPEKVMEELKRLYPYVNEFGI